MIPRRPSLRRRGEPLESRVAGGRCWCRRVDGPPPVPTSAPSKMRDRGAWHEWSPITFSSPLLFPLSPNRCNGGARASATTPALPWEGFGPARPPGGPSPPTPRRTRRRGNGRMLRPTDADEPCAATEEADTGPKNNASARLVILGPLSSTPSPAVYLPMTPKERCVTLCQDEAV